VLVFPRVAHRPRVYDSGELLWSPGAIDMAGIVVLPAEHDLDRVGAPDIESVYGEVSLDRETAADIAGRLESQ
jgi:hypothetical protein